MNQYFLKLFFSMSMLAIMGPETFLSVQTVYWLRLIVQHWFKSSPSYSDVSSWVLTVYSFQLNSWLFQAVFNVVANVIQSSGSIKYFINCVFTHTYTSSKTLKVTKFVFSNIFSNRQKCSHFYNLGLDWVFEKACVFRYCNNTCFVQINMSIVHRLLQCQYHQ